jgi:hypothetical protein
LANVGAAISLELLANEDPEFLTLMTTAGIAMIGGTFAAGIALVQLGVISSVMNLTTSLRLVELSRPDQPLLQRLLREAPGTFQHSLQVANLAELAAERIGADAPLLRVAATYHDIGKMVNPYFFVENQKGINPHDDINDPLRSARILISHVTDGDRMARRYRLPQRIRDFIREHHGTTQPYFYFKALKLADGDPTKVDIAEYSYPGPIPQTRESAILMLADSIESAARSIQPSNEEEVTKVVNMIFEKKLQEGQLDESGLTLNDLKAIREVFIDTLQGIYHTRIRYPGQEAPSRIAAPETMELPAGSEETSRPRPAAFLEKQPATEPERPSSRDGNQHEQRATHAVEQKRTTQENVPVADKETTEASIAGTVAPPAPRNNQSPSVTEQPTVPTSTSDNEANASPDDQAESPEQVSTEQEP